MTLMPGGANRIHAKKFHCCVKFIKEYNSRWKNPCYGELSGHITYCAYILKSDYLVIFVIVSFNSDLSNGY